MPTRTQTPALADVITERLRRMIVAGLLRPGERLFEPQLGEEFGVSRTPVREALKLLAAEGLVELRRNRNAIVARLDLSELASLFEVQVGLESFAAKLAAERMTAADHKRLAGWQVRLERHAARGEIDDYQRINRQIHRFIVSGARNPVLTETHGWLFGRLERARNLALSTTGRIEESILDHRLILKTLEQRDADGAFAIMARHVGRTGAIVAALGARDLTLRRDRLAEKRDPAKRTAAKSNAAKSNAALSAALRNGG